MTSHVTGNRRRLRTCLAMLGAGAVGFGALAVPAAAAPSIEPLNDPDPTVLVGTSASQASVTGSAFGSRATGDWFVEFRSLPIAKGGTQTRINNELQSLQAAADDLDIEVTSSYDQLWAGAVVSADDVELTKLRAEADIVAVYPVLLVEAPEKIDFGAEPQMGYANDMTGASLVHNEFNEYSATGKGQTIAIIDSGVDIDHPAFGGLGENTPWSTITGNGGKIIGGYDLVGDTYNADPSDPAYQPIPEPDENPDDCGGHGTHVAGIAAGNEAETGFVGVAPDANILAYRVFGCGGSTNSSIMLEAMERAAVDGADIVNMSIGASFMTWPNYPTGVAADNLVDKGVVVTVSQGNSGEQGVFSGGAPASAQKVISVGSIDNVASQATAISVDGIEGLMPYAPASDSPLPPKDNEPIGIIAYPEADKIGGVPLDGAEGKVVLVQRGEISFYEKALAAQESGAAGVIIDNNEPGGINATVAGDVEITIPVVTISQADGEAIRDAIADAEAPTMAWTDQTVVSEIATGGMISDFSSYGLAANLSIKPQVSAPGGFIHSAYPLDASDDDGSGYATMSGTSMAAPHVAGAVALIMEASPHLSPAQILTALQNNADPVPLSLAPVYPEMVHRQGAGMINIPRTILNANIGTMISPSELSLTDDDEGRTKTRTLTVTNSGSYTITLTPKHEASTVTGGLNYSPLIYGGIEATVTFSADELVLEAGETKTIDVTITAPEAPGFIYSGYIYFENGNVTNVVPYAGMAGNYETDRPFMYPWTYEEHGYTAAHLGGGDPNTPTHQFPALGALVDCDLILEGSCAVGGSYGFAPAGFTYSMEEGDYPLAILELENAVSYMKMEAFHVAFDGTKGDPVNPGYNLVYESDGEVYVPGIQVYEWDGTYRASASSAEKLEAPDGEYMLEITVVKGMGSIDNPDDVETWTSHAFHIGDDEPSTGPGDGAIDEDVDKGFLLYNDFTSPAAHYFKYGREGDEVFVGDWDGDGVDTVGVRRGKTFYVQNKLMGGNAEIEFKYGREGDEVLVGDWNGDGKDSFAVRRGKTFYAQNELKGGNAEDEFKYGREGDEVLVGDWDGDGYDTFGVRRGVTFFLQNELKGGNAMIEFKYGREADEVFVGDWNGDGVDTFTVRRDNTFYVSNQLVSSNAQHTYVLGRASDEVLVGDWNGDGIDSVGLRR